MILTRIKTVNGSPLEARIGFIKELQHVVLATPGVRFELPFTCCLYYVRYWHLHFLQVVQAFKRDSIDRMSTGHSIQTLFQ